MSYLFTDNLEKYLGAHLMERHSVLKEMEHYAEKTGFPIVGPQVGQLLYILTSISHADNVFEVGSGFGYSALWFALAMNKNGNVVCTEYDQENIDRAHNYLGRVDTPRASVNFLMGDGIDILSGSTGQYDIIFNDASKEDYPKVLEIAASKLRKNGLLIADNVLWHGQVTDAEPDTKTAAVVEYNKALFNSNRFFSSIIPIRDGISVSIRL
jgi:caffeoyl-CoA O-methyltransferase